MEGLLSTSPTHLVLVHRYLSGQASDRIEKALGQNISSYDIVYYYSPLYPFQMPNFCGMKMKQVQIIFNSKGQDQELLLQMLPTLIIPELIQIPLFLNLIEPKAQKLF